MGAIFGIVYADLAIADPTALIKMQTALQHRAIDGSTTASAGRAFFGHCRHEINLTSEDIPIQDEDYLITSDSRLSNRSELRNLLNLEDSPGISDAAFICNAYRKWGKDCCTYLTGEFVFVIYEKATGKIYAAADHMGFKSFYYYKSDRCFVFATEMKAIQATGISQHKLSKDIFAQYLSPLFSDKTYDNEIFILNAAHRLFADQALHIHKERYWQPGPKGKYHFNSNNEWVECSRELLITDITRRLNTKYQTGVTLSGGLDSSLIAGLTASILKKQNRELFCFSSVLGTGALAHERDEHRYISLMSQYHDNIRQVNVCPPEEEGPFSHWERSFERIERPTNKSLFVDDALCAAAQQHQVRVLLSGFGGDFTFSYTGQSMIYELFRKGNLNKAFSYLRLRKTPEVDWLRLFKRNILDYTKLRFLYNDIMDLRKKPEPSYLFTPSILKQINGNLKKERGVTLRDLYQKRYSSGKIGHSLFTANHNYAHFNLEINYPMLSREMVDLFYDIPPDQFMLNGQPRSLSRRIMEGYVPVEIQQRSDKGEYSPDFFRRFQSQYNRYFFEKPIELEEKYAAYINKELFNDTLAKLRGISSAENVPSEMLYITQTIKILRFMQSLGRKGYFDNGTDQGSGTHFS